MSKVLIVSDTHFGKKKDVNNSSFFNSGLDYFEQKLFKIIEKENINDIAILGDFFDSRKSLNVKILSTIIKKIFKHLQNKNIFMLVGNHEIYYSKTNEISTIDFLELYPNVKIIKTPEIISIGKTDILFVPFLANKKEREKFEQIKSTKSFNYIFSHFDNVEFGKEMGFYTNHIYANNVFSLKDFKDNYKIYSGHYHTYKEKGNYINLGSTRQINFGEACTDKYSIILDLESGKERKIINTYSSKFYNFKMPDDFEEIKQKKFNKNDLIKVVINLKTDEIMNYINNLRKNVQSLEVIDFSFKKEKYKTEIENFDLKAIDNIFDKQSLITFIKDNKNIYGENKILDNKIIDNIFEKI